ncbi:MAG: ABC transporter ATP-binding protein [Proteobacteria bacterium]|nr:ABC transporter ATP-binding protein [Pseudomonadota bacterium]
MLEIENIHVHYGKARVLEDVSLSVARGRIVCLIGANGAGKTTLLRTISGLVRPRTGTIRFLGEAVHNWPIDKIVRSGLVHVPEGRDIFTKLTVYQNLLLGSYTADTRKTVPGDMEKVWDYFPVLKKRRNQIAGTLSGGEQQMLATGRALMARPKMLLLDEPSQGLAPLITEAIFGILRTVNQAGTTVLLVEQNAYKALESSSDGYVLQNGRIVLQGPARELLENRMVQEHYFGA